MSTPTARSLAWARAKGWDAQTVERWQRIAKPAPGGPPGVRIDLFGFADIVCLDGLPGVHGIQATSAANVSARLAKARELPVLRRWLEAGNRLTILGWSKRGAAGKRKLWGCRAVVVTLADLSAAPSR